jgi:molybdenum cofactor cytidylyltransferase
MARGGGYGLRGAAEQRFDGRGALSGVVLAAGAGERMGGPKALLLVAGERLATLHVRRLREAGCATVLLVTRPELVARFGEESAVVASGAPDPAGSLAVGLEALRPEADDLIVITPVDAWPVEVATLAALVDAVRAGAEAATPLYAGRGGHPVVIRARALEAHRAPGSGSPPPLREVLGALGDARRRVAVDDPGIAMDLDTPEDVVAATGGAPQFG